MSADLGIHSAVSITQTQRDFGSFKVIEWVVVDEAEQVHRLSIYSDKRLSVENAPDQSCMEMPAELTESSDVQK